MRAHYGFSVFIVHNTITNCMVTVWLIGTINQEGLWNSPNHGVSILLLHIPCTIGIANVLPHRAGTNFTSWHRQCAPLRRLGGDGSWMLMHGFVVWWGCHYCNNPQYLLTFASVAISGVSIIIYLLVLLYWSLLLIAVVLITITKASNNDY